MHQGAFMGHNWSAASRRKASVSRARSVRAQNAVRAQWNVQVVRGKVTSRCLWNACKALSLGLVLMALGGGMATIGYFADQLSVNQEIRGNSTVHVKNESRGFHLNNLSYAGPIVMGVGGFIVVAACVMTFEARDSAAKVVPARFKPKTSPQKSRGDDGSGRRSAGCQTRWDNLGVFRAVAQGATTLGLATPLASAIPSPAISNSRRDMKAAFVHFSRTIQSSVDSAGTRRNSLPKCPSAPNLAALAILPPEPGANILPQFIKTPPSFQTPVNSSNGNNNHNNMGVTSGRRLGGGRRQSASLRHACPLLSPHPLQRQALSVDYTNCPMNYSPLMYQPRHSTQIEFPRKVERAGSEVSMAMDLHLPDDCQVTLKIRDQNRPPSFSQAAPRLHQRSETARRHQLTRQKPVDETSLETKPSAAIEILNEEPTRRRSRRHHHSRRDSTTSASGGKNGHRHRHRVRRSNTCVTASTGTSPNPLFTETRFRRSFDDQPPSGNMSLTPSPERSSRCDSTMLQVHNDSNPPSSTQSFELGGSDIEVIITTSGLSSPAPNRASPASYQGPSCSHTPDT